MTKESRSTNVMYWVVAALFFWAALIGLGSYLFAETNDLRKPLIVVGVMLAFLTVWMASWYLRNAKTKSIKTKTPRD